MSTRIIYINIKSLEIVFEGCLLKAPPLNRRGRKVRVSLSLLKVNNN